MPTIRLWLAGCPDVLPKSILANGPVLCEKQQIDDETCLWNEQTFVGSVFQLFNWKSHIDPIVLYIFLFLFVYKTFKSYLLSSLQEQ